MMILSWIGMILVMGAVVLWSRGQTRWGNYLGLASTLPWGIVGLYTDNYAMGVMQVFLAVNNMWALKGE